MQNDNIYHLTDSEIDTHFWMGTFNYFLTIRHLSLQHRGMCRSKIMVLISLTWLAWHSWLAGWLQYYLWMSFKVENN